MKSKVAWAAGWTSFSFIITKSLQFASNLVLTRLLYPEAFGLMALVNVVLVGITLLSDVGLRASVIQNKKGGTDEFLATVWTVKAIRGLVLSIIACLLAWPISYLYQQPLLLPLICFCSLKSFFDGAQSVLLLKAQRDMQLKRLVFLQIGTQVFSFIVTVTLALTFKTVWALAIGSVTAGLFQLFLSHLYFRFEHRFFIDREVLRDLISFGRWLLFATAVTFLGGQGLKGVEGYLLGPNVLGFLYISAMLAAFIEQGYKSLAGQVLFPYLSKIHRHSDASFFRKFYKARIICLAPAIIGLILVSLLSGTIISALYDDRYSAASPFLAIAALNTSLGILPSLYADAVLARGHSKLYSVYLCVYSILIIVGTLLGFYISGAIGMLIGQGIAAIVGYFFAIAITWKYSIATIMFDIFCLTLIALGSYLTFLINFQT